MRKYGLYRFIIILLLITIGCALGVNEVTYIKTSSNYQIHSMDIAHALSGGKINISLYLNPQVISDPDGNLAYSFIVIEKSSDKYFMEIGKDKSLVLIIDDKQYAFKPASQIFVTEPEKHCKFVQGIKITRNPGNSVCETVCFSTSLDVIEKMANAQKVEMIVFGEEDQFEKGNFTPTHYEDFRKFLDYVYEKVENKNRNEETQINSQGG